MATRSTKLATAKPAAAVATLVLTVPAGYTYLAKSIFAYNAGGVNDNVFVWAGDPVTLVTAYILDQFNLAAGGKAEWEGWLTLNPGDTLYVYSQAGISHFWISGSKLPGIA